MRTCLGECKLCGGIDIEPDQVYRRYSWEPCLVKMYTLWWNWYQRQSLSSETRLIRFIMDIRENLVIVNFDCGGIDINVSHFPQRPAWSGLSWIFVRTWWLSTLTVVELISTLVTFRRDHQPDQVYHRYSREPAVVNVNVVVHLISTLVFPFCQLKHTIG